MVSRETGHPAVGAEVSRETDDLGPPPAALIGAYPGAAAGLEAFARSLATAGVERGLIGPREVPRLWERHLFNCAVVEELVSPEASVADVGSGAGLPGLVLALVRPDLSVTLIEPLLRRSQFLNEMVAELALSNVEVLRSRAEDVAERSFDVVTSRAVAPLDRLARWCGPLITDGGLLLALKGQRADAELAEHGQVLQREGLIDARVIRVGDDAAEQTTVVLARKDLSSASRSVRGSRGRSRR